MSTLHHALITRFSIRRLFGERGADVLSPERLKSRLELFQVSCLPTVLAQTRQDFDWVVFVDPDLPDAARAHLETLVAQRPRSHILPFRPGAWYERLHWLRPWLASDTTQVMTTLIDDDDGLRSDYVEWLAHHATEHPVTADAPLRFIGCENAVQWDLRYDERAPLGTAKPWTRRDVAWRPYPVSAGFTLLVKAPELALCVGAFSHAIAPNTCRADDEVLAERPHLRERVMRARATIRDACADGTTPWDGTLSLERDYHACTLPAPQAVMGNHPENAEAGRRFEAAPTVARVRPGSSFPGVAVDFEQAARYLAHAPDWGA